MEPNLKALSVDYRLQEYHLTHFSRLTAEQAEQVRQWRNHPDVRQWMYQDHEISPEEHARFMKGQQQPIRSSFWFVLREASGVGVIGLTDIDWRNEHAFLGFYTRPGSPPGTGSQLLMLMMHLFFEELKLHSLKLTAFANNSKALTLYKKMNFSQEGILKEMVMRDAKRMDVIAMGISRTAYQEFSEHHTNKS